MRTGNTMGQLSKRILTLLVLLFVVTAFIVATSRSQKLTPQTNQDGKIVNNTGGLEILTCARNGQEIYLAFRNNYEKKITAFAVSIGNFRFTEEFVYAEAGDGGVPPHAIYERRVPIPTSIANDPTKPINIEAVILEDGSGDGRPAVVREIQDDRLCRRIQIERALVVLTNYLEFNSTTNGDFKELKLEMVSQLDAKEKDNVEAFKRLQPQREANVLSEEVKGGLDTAKQSILRKLQEAETANNQKEELIKVKEHFETLLRRLE